MNYKERENLRKEEQEKREVKELEKRKKEAKLVTKISTKSERMSQKFVEYLCQKRIFHTVDFSKGNFIIQIMGLTSTETNRLMKKMIKQMKLSTSKQEPQAPAA
jgi:hypothetical protein